MMILLYYYTMIFFDDPSSFARFDAALVNMSGWITEAETNLHDSFLPDYFQTRRSFHIRHGVFRTKLGKKGSQDIFEVFDW